MASGAGVTGEVLDQSIEQLTTNFVQILYGYDNPIEGRTVADRYLKENTTADERKLVLQKLKTDALLDKESLAFFSDPQSVEEPTASAVSTATSTLEIAAPRAGAANIAAAPAPAAAASGAGGHEPMPAQDEWTSFDVVSPSFVEMPADWIMLFTKEDFADNKAPTLNISQCLYLEEALASLREICSAPGAGLFYAVAEVSSQGFSEALAQLGAADGLDQLTQRVQRSSVEDKESIDTIIEVFQSKLSRYMNSDAMALLKTSEPTLLPYFYALSRCAKNPQLRGSVKAKLIADAKAGLFSEKNQKDFLQFFSGFEELKAFFPAETAKPSPEVYNAMFERAFGFGAWWIYTQGGINNVYSGMKEKHPNPIANFFAQMAGSSNFQQLQEKFPVLYRVVSNLTHSGAGFPELVMSAEAIEILKAFYKNVKTKKDPELLAQIYDEITFEQFLWRLSANYWGSFFFGRSLSVGSRVDAAPWVLEGGESLKFGEFGRVDDRGNIQDYILPPEEGLLRSLINQMAVQVLLGFNQRDPVSAFLEAPSMPMVVTTLVASDFRGQTLNASFDCVAKRPDQTPVPQATQFALNPESPGLVMAEEIFGAPLALNCQGLNPGKIHVEAYLKYYQNILPGLILAMDQRMGGHKLQGTLHFIHPEYGAGLDQIAAPFVQTLFPGILAGVLKELEGRLSNIKCVNLVAPSSLQASDRDAKMLMADKCEGDSGAVLLIQTAMDFLDDRPIVVKEHPHIIVPPAAGLVAPGDPCAEFGVSPVPPSEDNPYASNPQAYQAFEIRNAFSNPRVFNFGDLNRQPCPISVIDTATGEKMSLADYEGGIVAAAGGGQEYKPGSESAVPRTALAMAAGLGRAVEILDPTRLGLDREFK